MNKDTLLLVTNIHNYFFLREKRRREEEDAKDPRVYIELFGKPQYESTPVSFFFVTKYNKQVNEILHCRDYLSDCFRAALHERGGNHWKLNYPKPELDELRLVMWCKTLNEKKVKSGLRVVNMYARLADWPRTKVYSARIESKSGKWLNVYLLVGPKEWQRYPQLLSLFILLFRLARLAKIPKYIEDPYALECFWEELIRSKIKEGGEAPIDIREFLPVCYKRLIVLMKNEKEIFSGSLEEAWPKGDSNNRTGIYSMCRMTSTHPAADAKLQKFYLEEMEKHPKSWR